ncbi:DUF3394 domain-containing protein [Sedimentitalea sp. XS_ASV28]|uniref:DUF3394 domain-containing protein n=1 Tax=Sedimentitalea sp. XS_ASV28 TaxID=3241296 RepID=UPI00351979A7
MEPAILMQGNRVNVAIVIAQATIGVILLAAALQRYFFGRLQGWKAVLLFAASICLIYPDLRVTLLGLGIAGAILAMQKLGRRDQPTPVGDTGH